jgi:hypothetical protein
LRVINLWSCTIFSELGRQRDSRSFTGGLPTIMGVTTLWPDYRYARPLLVAGVFSFAVPFLQPLRCPSSFWYSLIYVIFGIGTNVLNRFYPTAPKPTAKLNSIPVHKSKPAATHWAIVTFKSSTCQRQRHPTIKASNAGSSNSGKAT